jgi:hypothetical protein
MDSAFDDASVLGFKDGQAGVEQFAPGHDNYVVTLGNLVPTKNLSNQAFS